jgi:hypothetical protein
LAKLAGDWQLSTVTSCVIKRQYGAAGDTMGDRLRAAEKVFSRYNDLWSAHKFRNKLVHEPNVKLTKQLAERILREYARALKELGALE